MKGIEFYPFPCFFSICAVCVILRKCFCTTGFSANVGMDQLWAQVTAYSMESVAEVPKN